MNSFKAFYFVALLIFGTLPSCTKEIATEIKSEKRFINSLNGDIVLRVSSNLVDTSVYIIVAGDSVSFEATCPDAGDGRFCMSNTLPESTGFEGYFGIEFDDNSVAEYRYGICDSIGIDPSLSFQLALAFPNSCGFSFANVNNVVVHTYLIDSTDYRWAN